MLMCRKGAFSAVRIFVSTVIGCSTEHIDRLQAQRSTHDQQARLGGRMKFEHRVMQLLFIFVGIVLGTTLTFYFLFSDPAVIAKKPGEIQFFAIFSVIGVIFSFFRIIKLTEMDREIFIRSLVVDRQQKYRSFKEFRRLMHAYEMERHAQRLDSVEKQHLEEILGKKENDILTAEAEMKGLQKKMEELLHGIEEKEKTFIIMANCLNEGIWVSDRNGILTFANNFIVSHMRVTAGDHVSGVFCLSAEDCSYFSQRDFKDIEVKLWDSAGKKVLLSNKRVFLADVLQNVIYHSREVTSSEDIIKRNQDFNFISDTFDTLSQNMINKQSIQMFLEKMCLFGEFQSASIRLVSNDKKTLDIYAIYQDSVFVLNKEKHNLSNSHMGHSYKTQTPVLINEAKDMLFEEPIILNTLSKGLTINYFPLRIQGIDIGVLSIISDKALNHSMVLLIKSVCINLTIALEKILIYDRLKNNFFDIIGAFFLALEMKSKNLRGHSSRVAMVCKMIAEQLYYSVDEVDNLYSAALLHDVGKLLFVDKSYKHGFDIREHGYFGRMIMERVGANKEIIQGIEFHHHDYRSEKGVQPIFSQFIRLANDFDLYFHIDPTIERARRFIHKIGRHKEGEYSPNLLNVLEHIINNETDGLLKIYEVKDA